MIGYNGSDDGVRGSLVAYDANTGKEAWRFWTVPGDPSKKFETKALEMAAKTWSGKDSWKIGGGDVWNAITYDPVTNFVIFGTAGAGVDYGELSSIKVTGDRLFAGCIIAVNADTGEYVWHFQTSGPLVQTENNHILMADVMVNGEQRHVAMTAPKNGFFYVLDAKTGKLVSAKPLAKLAWADSYNLETGRPMEIPPSQGGGKQWTVHNWWPMSYDPITNLVYVPATDRIPNSHAVVESGEWMKATEGRLIAWDPIGEAARWSVRRADCNQWWRALHCGQSGFSGSGIGRICCVRGRQRKKVVVASDRLCDSIDSRNVLREGRTVRVVSGRLGFGIAAVRSCVDDGDSEIETRTGASTGVQTRWRCTFSNDAGRRPASSPASATNCQRGNDPQGTSTLWKIRLRRMSFARSRRQRRVGAERRGS